jgi:hypothetical protein
VRLVILTSRGTLMEGVGYPDQLGLTLLDYSNIQGHGVIDLKRFGAGQVKPKLSQVNQDCTLLGSRLA